MSFGKKIIKDYSLGPLLGAAWCFKAANAPINKDRPTGLVVFIY